MKHLTLLGSTGSIGCSTLDVVRHNPEHYTVTALVAGKNVQRMVEQCLEFMPRYAVMDDDESARQLKTLLLEKGSRTEVLSGSQAACDMAALDEVDQVMAAIVGAAGLLPTLAAIDAGKDVLLANKESLVTCGRLFMDAVKQRGARLLPVDSEHNAIFQSLPQPFQQNLGYADLEQNGVVSILLTGSGGPFRETPLSEL
ncbi:1-deoxy-D-xylulose-5-phosphate reductoisomerase, partial [Enterobacter kobei]